MEIYKDLTNPASQEFEKLLTIEKNRQLNNFSIIHFNKIKKNINISEI